jgi:hypothetical protein
MIVLENHASQPGSMRVPGRFWNITFIAPFFFVASRKAGEPFDWSGPVLLSTPCG